MVKETPQRLLVVGPLPPPIAGTSVSFQIFCDLLHRHPDQVEIVVINSAPKKLGHYSLLTRSHFETARRIIYQFTKKIRDSDQVLIFGSDQFLFSMVPICLNIAKLAGKPCYIRVFGGSLDRYYMELHPILRRLFRATLRRADGLIVQTELLHKYFTQVLGNKVHYVPGYRPLLTDKESATPHECQATGPLRVIFTGHIREEKGVFVLLESLRNLSTNGNTQVQCDLYGPIYAADSQRFQQELAQTPNAAYKGLLNPEQVVSTLRGYAGLIFPTYYWGEGHPGVVIEAMMAGIPVIATRFRSIPEIIHNGQNGLLVEPQNVQQLEEAIQYLSENHTLLTTMGQQNWAMRTQFSSAQQVPCILQPLGIQI